MARIDRAWRARKGWLTQLHLNIGLNEGHDWLGTFNTPASIEFTVVGETINHAARLSDLARHGAIWATKNFVSKVSGDHLARVRCGVRRHTEDGRETFVEGNFARVADLIDPAAPKYDKLRDIGGLPVAGLIDFRE